MFNDEGVDTIEGLEVGEVRQKGIRGERPGHPDMNSLSVLEEAALAQVRQEAEFDVLFFHFMLRILSRRVRTLLLFRGVKYNVRWMKRRAEASIALQVNEHASRVRRSS